MKYTNERWMEYVKTPTTKEELEKAACDNLIECVDEFTLNNIRFGQEGLYLLIQEKVYVFSVDIQLVKECTIEEAPVNFKLEILDQEE